MRRPRFATSLSRPGTMVRHLSPRFLVAVALCTTPMLGFLAAIVPEAVVLMLIGLPIGIGLLMFPEVTLALYLNAGHFKADPRLQPISNLIDLTVALALILMAGVAYRLLLRKGTITWTKEVSLFIVLSAVVLVGSVYTPAPGYGQEKAIRFISLTLLAFVVPLAVVQSPQELHRFLLGMLGIGLVLAVEGLLEGGERFTAFGSNTLAMGYGAGAASLIALFLVLPDLRTGVLKAMTLITIGLLAVAMIGSGTRGSLLALVVSIAVTFFLSLALGHRRKFVLMSVIAMAGIVVFVFSSSLVPASSLERFNVLLHGTETQVENSSASTRLFYWRQSLALFSKYPLVGSGTGGFAWFVSGGDIEEYPHNIVLELATETGIVGLTIFACLVLFTVQNLLSALHVSALIEDFNRSLLVTLFAILTFELVGAMLSGDLNDGRGLWALFGVIIAVSRRVSLLTRGHSKVGTKR
jgi:O-antigen ligase